MTFAHRYFLRTRVERPQGAYWRSTIYLHIPSVNFIATLFVNGKQVAWNNTAVCRVGCRSYSQPQARRQRDLDRHQGHLLRASRPSDGKNLRYSMVLPTEFFNSNQGVSMQLDYPVWNHMENGILQEPSLVVAGGAYTSDVFAMPSVKTEDG
jgi:hypothetical protein